MINQFKRSVVIARLPLKLAKSALSNAYQKANPANPNRSAFSNLNYILDGFNQMVNNTFQSAICDQSNRRPGKRQEARVFWSIILI